MGIRQGRIRKGSMRREERKMTHRSKAAAIALIAGVTLVPMLAAAQTADATGPPHAVGPPRSPGHLGLPHAHAAGAARGAGGQGVPDRGGGRDARAGNTRAQTNSLLNRAPETTSASNQVDRRADGTPGFYNNFWLDRGTTAIATRRTSLVVDPADGRLPALTEPARAAAPIRPRRPASRVCAAAGCPPPPTRTSTRETGASSTPRRVRR